MNKQNQELRSLNQIVQENSQKVFDDFLSEELVVLGESPLYSDSYAVDQYKDLLYEINFTKIADMLHLITHYGVVSNAQIEKAKRSTLRKKIEELSIRRFYTEKYLQQYNLRDVDRSLDKIFPNPIGRHNEARWYTVASEMILNEFRRIGLKIDNHSDCLYFTNDYAERQCVSKFSIASFAEFLMIVMHTSEIFDYQLDWTKPDLTRLAISFSTDVRFRSEESQAIEG